MGNPFYEGQKVICISESFPPIKKYGTGHNPPTTPKNGEILVIDEILGEFLRFDKYDDEDTIRWWYYNRFAPIDENNKEHEEEKCEKQLC